MNPYGVAFVPQDFVSGGAIHPGDVLVANFNDKANVQGTGTTIVSVSPTGAVKQFFHGASTPGLDTALGVLESGFVLVGNVPTTDGTFKTIKQGSLTILDKDGHVVSRLTDNTLLDGPWDLTVHDEGGSAQVFVSNVLKGTVTRIDLKIPEGGKPIVESLTQIASGYTVMPNMAAVVVGPTGLAYDASRDILYVASTGDNKIFAISNAKTRTGDGGKGQLVFQDNAVLRGPLGLALAPNGDLITANGDAINGNAKFPSELVEFTPDGHFVAQRSVDTGGEGGAFGLAIESSDDRITLAAVDDVTNTLKVFTIHEQDGDDDGMAAALLSMPTSQDSPASKLASDGSATVGTSQLGSTDQGIAASATGSGEETFGSKLPKAAAALHQSTRHSDSADFTGAIDWGGF